MYAIVMVKGILSLCGDWLTYFINVFNNVIIAVFKRNFFHYAMIISRPAKLVAMRVCICNRPVFIQCGSANYMHQLVALRFNIRAFFIFLLNKRHSSFRALFVS